MISSERINKLKYLKMLILWTQLITGCLCITKYIPVEPGAKVQGQAVIYTSRSKLDCAKICSQDECCGLYEYQAQKFNNCFAIHLGDGGVNRTIKNQPKTYEKVCQARQTYRAWQLCNSLSLHLDFESIPGNMSIGFMNGASFTEGKINQGLHTNATLEQWIDLGDLSHWTCLHDIISCEPNGATVALWVLTDSCPQDAGIISTRKFGGNGFTLSCRHETNRIGTRVQISYDNIILKAIWDWEAGWLHYAIVFHGLDAKGITVYVNGQKKASSNLSMKTNPSQPTSPKQMIIGKRLTTFNRYYYSIKVDELIMWNRTLSCAEVKGIYHSYI